MCGHGKIYENLAIYCSAVKAPSFIPVASPPVVGGCARGVYVELNSNPSLVASSRSDDLHPVCHDERQYSVAVPPAPIEHSSIASLPIYNG